MILIAYNIHTHTHKIKLLVREKIVDFGEFGLPGIVG